VKSSLNLAAVLAAGLLLRLAMWWAVPIEVGGDAYHHLRLAVNLREGHGFSHSPGPPYYPDLVRPPGFVYLAAVWPLPLFSLQLALSIGTALLLHARLRRLCGLRRALLAVAIYFLSPYSAFFCLTALNDVLATFLLMALIELTWRAWERGGAFTYGLLGLVAAALILTKPPLLVFIPLALAVTALHSWRNTLLAVLVMAAGVAPWTCRNYHLTGRATPTVTASFGVAFWIGVTLDRNINLTAGRGTDLWEHFLVQWNPIRPGQPSNDLPDSSVQAVNDELGRHALQAVREHPLRYLRHTLAQAFDLWWDANDQVGWHAKSPNEALRLLTQVSQRALIVLALIGLWQSRGRPEAVGAGLGLLLLTLLYALVHVETRYTLPAQPILAALAAVAINRVLSRESGCLEAG
jgi:4-amino-4-deoxy-L-arabinose transferase-like glycosyltransferase